MADPELSAEALRERLLKELGAEHVEVEETLRCGGSFRVLVVAAMGRYGSLWVPQEVEETLRCGGSFRVLVVAAAFRGMGLLHRQRMVNAALGAALGRIHALEQRTLTPEQWAAERGAGTR